MQHLHAVGEGCPDILVGWRGVNLLMEIKDGTKPPSKRRLTPDQKRWRLEWNGQHDIVYCPDDALEQLWLVNQTGSRVPAVPTVR